MHSLLIVVGGGNLDELMHPYWEGLEVDEYLVGEVDESDKQRIMRYYSNQDGVAYPTFDSCYEKHGKDWNDNAYRKGDDGVWRQYSRFNPNSKWDWYQVGGRWAGRIALKEGAELIRPVEFSWGWSKEEQDKVLNAVPRRADIAYLKDIENLDELVAGAILIDGEWEDLTDWEYVPVKPYLEGLPGDTLITFVDYHE